MSVAMCALMSSLADRMDSVESSLNRPSDESICLESVVQGAVAPLLESAKSQANRAPKTSKASQNLWNVVAGKRAKNAPKKQSFREILGATNASRPKSTVTGTVGEYIGAKVDRTLKIQVGESYTSEKVLQAVQAATKCEEGQLTIEALAKVARNYSISYRVRIKAMRADLAAALLETTLWPAGMQVTQWKGPWQPLRKYNSIKLFIGNINKSTEPAVIADKIKGIYEKAGVEIESSTAEAFVGKKESTNCQNLVVTVNSTKPGITMEPIQAAKMDGTVPAGIFVRMYGERHTPTAPTW